jgi:hypothetical protein
MKLCAAATTAAAAAAAVGGLKLAMHHTGRYAPAYLLLEVP